MSRPDQFQAFGRIAASLAEMAIAKAIDGLENIDGEKIGLDCNAGVPLSELDLDGNTARRIVLQGPDEVRIATGDRLSIDVEGEDALASTLRFDLTDETLTITRQASSWRDRMPGKATVRITMPPPSRLSVAGSGSITSDALAKEKASLTVAGSGRLICRAVAAARLKVRILGSGTLDLEGSAERLKIAIAGSGLARMEGLSTPKARIRIAGSGSAIFASDGSVEANIAGSGSVTVKGRANCTVTGVGSGRLVCQPA